MVFVHIFFFCCLPNSTESTYLIVERLNRKPSKRRSYNSENPHYSKMWKMVNHKNRATKRIKTLHQHQSVHFAIELVLNFGSTLCKITKLKTTNSQHLSEMISFCLMTLCCEMLQNLSFFLFLEKDKWQPKCTIDFFSISSNFDF